MLDIALLLMYLISVPHTTPQADTIRGKGQKMTNKEYKAKKENIETFCFLDYLKNEDIKQIRKNRKYDKGAPLPGANNRAYIRNDGEKITLVSYYTDVCYISAKNFVKLWDGYSVTTQKHINAFRQLFGLPSLNKREWLEME